MSPLLGPILAQLVTLGVSDRTEVRHVIAQDSYSEVATIPRVGLNFGWRHTTLTLSYGPSITVSPLEAKDPYLYVYQSATLTMSHRWQRTTLSVTETGSYGQVNLRAQALAGTGIPTGAPPPAAPGGSTTPPPAGGTGGMMQPPPGSTGTNSLPSLAVNQPITFASSTTAINLSQRVSARFSMSGGVSYFISGSLDGPSDSYPTVRGPGAQVLGTYRPTLDDTLSTSLFTQFADTSNGNRAWLLTANEIWAHRLSRRTLGTLGSGLSLTRNSQPNGYEFYSLYPNFLLGLNHMTWLGHAVLTVGGGASSAPFIDPFRGLVDPRVSTYAYAGFGKDKFSTTASASTGLQLVAGTGTGALNSVTGTLNVSYRLGTAVSVDGGLRTAWQGFRDQTTTTTVPISFAMYAGINVALAVPLRGRH